MCTINGQSYDWSTISISMLGNINIEGVAAIEYEETQESKTYYGIQNKPVFIGRGIRECKGKIGLYKYEVDKIRAAITATNKSLLDIPPFNIIVQYNNGTSPITTHSLVNCIFTKDGFSSKVGETDSTSDFDLAITCIQYS